MKKEILEILETSQIKNRKIKTPDVKGRKYHGSPNLKLRKVKGEPRQQIRQLLRATIPLSVQRLAGLKRGPEQI